MRSFTRFSKMPKLKGHVEWQGTPNPTFTTSSPPNNLHSIHATLGGNPTNLNYRIQRAAFTKTALLRTHIIVTLYKDHRPKEVKIVIFDNETGPGKPVGYHRTLIKKGHFDQHWERNTFKSIPPVPDQLYKKWLPQSSATRGTLREQQKTTQAMGRLAIAPT